MRALLQARREYVPTHAQYALSTLYRIRVYRHHAAASGRGVALIYLSTYNVAFDGRPVVGGDETLGYSPNK